MKPSIMTTEVPATSKQLWGGNNVNHVDILADIYQENTNIVFWKRSLKDNLTEAANSILLTNPDLQISLVVSPQDTVSILQARLDSSQMALIMVKDINIKICSNESIFVYLIYSFIYIYICLMTIFL